MDFATAVKIIMRDLEETRAILDEMEGAEGAPANEIELVKAKLRSAMEMLSILPRMGTVSATPAITEPPVSTPSTPSAATPVETAPAKRSPEKNQQEKEESAKNKVKTEPLPETDSENSLSAKPTTDAHDSSKNTKKEESGSGKAILADKFGSEGVLGEKLTSSKEVLGDKLSSTKSEPDMLTVLGSKPVNDITSAVGINDRFYFIRELFGNNSEEYYKAISRLNKASSLGEAINILDKSVVSRPDTDAYSAFTDVLKRKFPFQ